VNKSLN